MPASQVFSGSGNPNGVVDGNPGDVYQDQTGKFWLNVAAPSTWVQLSSGGGSDWYGNGADGPLHVAAGTTTLTRDMFYTTLLIDPGATLETAGFRVFAQTSIVNNGTIVFTPGDGTPAGVGGIAPQGSLPRSRDGAPSTIGGSTAPRTGVGGNALFPGTAGSAGTGGNSNDGIIGGPGGVSTVIVAAHGGMDIVLFGVTWFPLDQNNVTPLSWGASGGGGGGHSTGGGTPIGGGGGSGGGVLVLASPSITGAGTVIARGGKGGDGSNISGRTSGGGGGGQGGVIALVTDSGASPITTDVSGGTGGAAGGAGATAGTAGTAGVVRQYKVA